MARRFKAEIGLEFVRQFVRICTATLERTNNGRARNGVVSVWANGFIVSGNCSMASQSCDRTCAVVRMVVSMAVIVWGMGFVVMRAAMTVQAVEVVVSEVRVSMRVLS